MSSISPRENKADKRSQSLNRPFKKLKNLLEIKDLPEQPIPEPPVYQAPPHIENERDMFMAAMSDVIPLAVDRKRIRKSIFPKKSAKISRIQDQIQDQMQEDDPDREALSKLHKLIEDGTGFVVSQTSEYMEGAGCQVPSFVMRRLHQGDFSVQAYIDLHGLNVAAAQDAFEAFLAEAITTGKRTVLVVHGRGLSSPGLPVLKTKVRQWLIHGPFRKWIMAFTSARSCDGGAGATYVLLRERPITRRHKKKNRRI